MNKSDTLGALAKALVGAQKDLENPTKNARNPYFNSRYSDLAEVVNVTRPVLVSHGLSITQWLGMEEDRVTVETVLMHVSGEWMSSVASTPVAKQDPQGIGSAVTYLRRYSLAAVCGVAQEDDDGQAAAANPSHGQLPPAHVPTLEELDAKVDQATDLENLRKIWQAAKRYGFLNQPTFAAKLNAKVEQMKGGSNGTAAH